MCIMCNKCTHTFEVVLRFARIFASGSAAGRIFNVGGSILVINYFTCAWLQVRHAIVRVRGKKIEIKFQRFQTRD